MPLSEDEKVRIRHHLGYLNVAEAYTFVLGTPAAVETQFIVEGSMNRVLEAALPMVRNIVMRLDAAEAQADENQELLAIAQLGEITVRENEQEKLIKRYDRIVGELCNALGCARNPYDKRLEAGGVNVRVQHG